MDSDAVNYASVILPMAAPAEQDGTYTNVEGRVQRMRQVVAAPGDAKQAWRIFSELMLRTTPTRPFFNPGEVMDEIAATVPALAHATYAQLGDEGLLAGKAATADTVSDMN
jgi:predicted molibdopterin-dependent oxidoreductase YjgC